MELRVLRYFLATAQEESITKAAALLHVTQPTLSRQLMQLEDELGVKLFRRSQHRIILTEDGMLLRRRAQEIIELADKTEKEFLRRDGELTGENIHWLRRNAQHDLSFPLHPLLSRTVSASSVSHLQRQRGRCKGAD